MRTITTRRALALSAASLAFLIAAGIISSHALNTEPDDYCSALVESTGQPSLWESCHLSMIGTQSVTPAE